MDYKSLYDLQLAYPSDLYSLKSSCVPSAYATETPFCLKVDMLITVSRLPLAISLYRTLYSLEISSAAYFSSLRSQIISNFLNDDINNHLSENEHMISITLLCLFFLFLL